MSKHIQPVKRGTLYLPRTIEDVHALVKVSEPYIDTILMISVPRLSDQTQLRKQIHLYERPVESCLMFVDLLILWLTNKGSEEDQRLMNSLLFKRAAADKATAIDTFTGEDMKRASELYSDIVRFGKE